MHESLVIPPLPSDSPADRWRDRIIHGDALDVLAAEGVPPVDLVHTSPPYNIDRPYQEFTDRLHLDDYLTFVSRIAALLFRRMRPGASLFWQTGYTQASPGSDEINPIDVLTFPLFQRQGFYLKDRIVWRYFGGMAFKAKFKNQHETILWYVKGDPEDSTTRPVFNVDEVREASREYDPRNNLLGRNPGNVWEVDRVAFGSTEQTSHIAVFPEEVTERIVRACSRPGDLVLDPFTGSGTVAKVAKGLGRHYLGVEISAAYHREAVRRIGFQQFGEAATILSELVKLYLATGRGRATFDECAQGLIDMGRAKPSDGERRLAGYAEQVDGGSDVPKAGKAKLWAFADAFVEQLGDRPAANRGLLANVMMAYLRSYKLAKWFNGLRLALIARRLCGQLTPHLQEIDRTVAMVRAIVAAEPSSYELRKGGTMVEITSAARRVKLNGDGRTGSSRSGQRQLALF
jgi:adenine-specific DNA-methyltransferase